MLKSVGPEVVRAGRGAASARTAAAPFVRRFDAIMAALGTWVMLGVYADAWTRANAPHTGAFLVFWRALLYAGVLANAAFLGWNWARVRPGRQRWRQGFPPGYALSGGACLLFLPVWLGNLAWPQPAGGAHGFAGLISPAHIALAAAAGLLGAGPLRAAWQGAKVQLSWSGVWSAALVLSALTYFGQFDNPYIMRWTAGAIPAGRLPADSAMELGVQGVVLLSLSIMGVALLLVRRFKIPFFGFSLICAVNAVFATLIEHLSSMVLVAALGGLLIDILYWLIRPSAWRPARFHLFGALAPAPLFALYFGVLNGTGGIPWPARAWTGAILAAALGGWLLSLLAVPGSFKR